MFKLVQAHKTHIKMVSFRFKIYDFFPQVLFDLNLLNQPNPYSTFRSFIFSLSYCKLGQSLTLPLSLLSRQVRKIKEVVLNKCQRQRNKTTKSPNDKI